MGRKALSEEEKQKRDEEKQKQDELNKKDFEKFKSAKLCDLVDANVLEKFYNKVKGNEGVNEAQVLEMLIGAFNKGVIELKVEIKKEYSIGIK